uniref:Spy/CpxP family protein refolding chaperone n=1 Tax=Limnohabitans sp. TaxID=1907725 RepID=UPI004048E8A6
NTTPPADNARVGRMEKMREHRGERHTQHLAQLKAKLNLQAAQEPAWNTFIQSMQPPARIARPERASVEKMTTPERLDMMQAMKAQRDAHIQQRSEATLNAEQKQVFDKENVHKMKGFGMHGTKHEGGRGHH